MDADVVDVMDADVVDVVDADVVDVVDAGVVDAGARSNGSKFKMPTPSPSPKFSSSMMILGQARAKGSKFKMPTSTPMSWTLTSWTPWTLASWTPEPDQKDPSSKCRLTFLNCDDLGDDLHF